MLLSGVTTKDHSTTLLIWQAFYTQRPLLSGLKAAEDTFSHITHYLYALLSTAASVLAGKLNSDGWEHGHVSIVTFQCVLFLISGTETR